jgi:mRNA interferase MazF
MVATIKTSLSIPKTLCNQAEILAQTLKISRNHLFRIAIENFIRNYQSQTPLDEINKPGPNEQSSSSYQDAKPATQNSEERLVINQGDIYWVQLEDLSESEPDIRHPHVVIQDNVFNHSRINTVVACALTSNIKRANTPGNVLLEVGEANLLKQSVVEVSKVSTVDKTQLGEYIGSLTEQRINQILAGMRFLQRSFFTR